MNGLDRAEAERRIDRLLTRVGLAANGDDRVGTFSRGMRQRLGIADALVKEPAVLVLDEPTTAIDPRGVREMLDLIRELADDGVAVLLSSHLLHQVQAICDRVGVFVGGHLVAVGTLPELAEQLGVAGTRLELEVAEGDPRPALEGSPEIVEVAPDPGLAERWLVTAVADGGRDPREAAARAVTTAGLTITHLRRRGDELDEIYLRYFTEDHADQTAPEPVAAAQDRSAVPAEAAASTSSTEVADGRDR